MMSHKEVFVFPSHSVVSVETYRVPHCRAQSPSM